MADDISEDLPLARFQGVIPATATCWQPGDPDGRLIAGVSSFGMSGTNAHVVLGESRAHRAATPAAERRSGASLLFLSARTPASVQALADAYADAIEASPDIDLHALCDAALATRQVWPHASIAVAAGSPAELVERLRERCAAPVPTTRLQRVAMVFTGQGSQYAGMSRSLFDANRRFRALLTEFADHVDSIVGWSTPLLPRMLATGQAAGATLPLVREQRTSQLSLLVLQCALARFWQELGCRPYAVLGHSVGEYAAAWFAGAFDFDTAARQCWRAPMPWSGRVRSARKDAVDRCAAADRRGTDRRGQSRPAVGRAVAVGAERTGIDRGRRVRRPCRPPRSMPAARPDDPAARHAGRVSYAADAIRGRRIRRACGGSWSAASRRRDRPSVS